MADVNDNNAVPTTWEEIFQHPRFKQLVEAKKQADETASKLTAEIENLKKAFESQLQEASKQPQGELQTLQEQLRSLQDEYKATVANLQKEQAGRMRLQVAQELGIPDWADELKGETPEQLKAHGEQIMARIQARLEKSSPGIPPRGNGSPTAAPTAAQLSDPKWVRENQQKILDAAR